MRYVKMLGIATMAAAALSAFAASSASAAGETLPNTVLCETAETTCAAGNQMNGVSGTAITATLKAGTKAKLKAGFAVIECAKSSVAGTATWNAANHTPHAILTTETFTECNAGQTVTVEQKAEVIIHHEIEAGHTDTGALTVVGGRIKAAVGSTSCAYGGTIAGSSIHAQGGNPAIIAASLIEGETKLTKLEGGILCASPAEWIAGYEVTSPKPLHFSTT
jgi:hypothetical protein